jgi:signal peptidase I
MSDSSASSATRLDISPEQRKAILRRVNRSRSNWRAVWDWLKLFQIAVFLFLIIKTFIVEAFKIPTGSMENTLLVGDFLLVNKAVYGATVPFTDIRLPAFSVPERGDVIVFEFPDPRAIDNDEEKNFVKRVVGIAGDTVEMRDGDVWRNGERLDESYVIHSSLGSDAIVEEFGWQRHFLVRRAEAHSGYHPSRNRWGPLIVPEGNYFVLGDNRDNSYDSRYWGFVPDSLVKGQPLVVYYSFERDRVHRAPWLTNIRWSRLGERIR